MPVGAVSSVNGLARLAALVVDTAYSATLAESRMRSPTATVGAVLVKTKTPSDVVVSLSPSGSCR